MERFNTLLQNLLLVVILLGLNVLIQFLISETKPQKLEPLSSNGSTSKQEAEQ